MKSCTTRKAMVAVYIDNSVLWSSHVAFLSFSSSEKVFHDHITLSFGNCWNVHFLTVKLYCNQYILSLTFWILYRSMTLWVLSYKAVSCSKFWFNLDTVVDSIYIQFLLAFFMLQRQSKVNSTTHIQTSTEAQSSPSPIQEWQMVMIRRAVGRWSCAAHFPGRRRAPSVRLSAWMCKGRSMTAMEEERSQADVEHVEST